MQAVDPVSPLDKHYSTYQRELQEQEKFLDVLEKLDAYLESQKKTRAEEEEEKRKARLEEDKEKRLQELRWRIAELRSKVNMGYSTAEAELFALQNELFMLLLFG